MSPHAHLARSPVGLADQVWLEPVGREPGENSPWYRSHAGVWGQTEFQVNLKLGLTPRRPTPRRPDPKAPEAEGGLQPGRRGLPGPAAKAGTTGGSELLDAMEAMKPLVGSLGKEQVKRIVDLLG